MSDAQVLEARDVGPVRVLTMCTGPKVNPLTEPLQQALLDALAAVRCETAVRAVVLTGAGRSFCVGADLTAVNPRTAGAASVGARTAASMERFTNRVVMALADCPVPVVCALNGVATGAGTGLALAGDITIAARSAWLQLPFMNRLGIVPDMGASWFLQRTLGAPRAMALAMLGDKLTAEQGVQWGLLWCCVEDAALMDEALALAQRLAALPAHAAPELRALFRHAATQPLPAQLAYEAARQRELLDEPAFAEGVRAFFERRDPRFPPRTAS